MVIKNKNANLLIFAGIVFFFLNLAMPILNTITKSISIDISDIVYAEEEEEGEEEETGLIPEELLKEGYVQFPEALANADNPNSSMAKPDAWNVPIGKFALFGLSNRDITWIMSSLHILFASFILGCPLFVIVSEACGAKKTPAVKKACAVLSTVAGLFVGSVVGMIGEVILEAHGSVKAACFAGIASALVVAVMVITDSIKEENKMKRGAVVGSITGLIAGTIFAHGAGAFLGVIIGLIAGIAAVSIMLSKENPQLERLAHECMKVVAVCYSFTALSGGFFLLLLVAYYPTFISWLVRGFNDLTTVWYPVIFVIETVFMYLYYYMWDPLNNTGKKATHLILGLLLNVAGVSLLILMDAPASFMLTPTKVAGSLKDIASFGEVAWINNFTWWPLNFHRLVGNLTYGGFIVAFIGALMYLWAKNDEDRSYYDWQGYIGNALGLGFMLPLPIMGYIYAKEVYQYDAAIGMYIMSDRLSMFMLMQGLLIGFLFIGANYYMWVSVKRVEGHEKFLTPMKCGFVLLFVCAAIWYSPRHFFATMMLEPGMLPAGMAKDAYLASVELPGPLSIFALMQAKNTAATLMVVISLINYIIYRIACSKGKIVYGKVNPLSQYILVFLVFSNLWLMTLMGSIRELARKNFHVYKVLKDVTADAYTPTLSHAAKISTITVWIFFIMITAIVWMQLKYVKSHSKGH